MTTTMTSTGGKEWARIQEKTFRRWINSKLFLALGEEPIADLKNDLEDGVFLTILVSFLSPYSIEPSHRNPKHRLHKLENLKAVFDFMKYNDIRLYNIGPEDILEGNMKLILGLVWTLIAHFSTMKNTSGSATSMKDNLLQWCQGVTKNYKNVNVKDFTKSWNSGLTLCAMIHHFHPELIRFSKLNPNNKMENTTLALEISTRKLGIPQLIDVEDLICDHPDEKSITAYIIEWHHRFAETQGKETPSAEAIPTVSGSETSSKKEVEAEDHNVKNLLFWCNQIMKKANLTKVTDFSSSFQDGIALCAVVNDIKGCTIDIDALQSHESDKNISLALKVAADKLNIEAKFDAADLRKSSTDNQQLISFLGELHHIYLVNSGNGTAAIQKFVDAVNETKELQNNYEDRAAYLIDCIDAQLSVWGTLSHINHCKTYEEVRVEADALDVYRMTLKRKWLKEKSDLNVLLSNIKTKLATHNLHPYHPSGDLSPKFIDCLWLSLTDIEKEAFRRINLILKKIQDDICQKYATCAEAINEIFLSCEESLMQLNGGLEEQLELVTHLLETLKPVDSSLAELKTLDAACKEAGIMNNDYTSLSYDELHFESEILRNAINEKVSFIEAQNQLITSTSTAKMTIDQVELFETVFNKIVSKSGQCLTLNDFKHTLRLSNLQLEDDEILELYDYGKADNSEMALEGFLKCMTELVGQDDMNAESLLESFKFISGGKPFLTDEDMAAAKLDPDTVSKIQNVFPKYQKASEQHEDDEEDEMANTSYDFIQLVSEVAGLSLPGEGETLDGASIYSHSSNLHMDPHLAEKSSK